MDSKTLLDPPSPDVLLVEDNASLRSATAEMLGAAGILVATAADGISALDLNVTPRILITDVRMPGLDGFELARRLRQRAPRTAILFVSSHFDTQPPVLVGQGPVESWTKPLDVERLIAQIKQWLADPAIGSPAASGIRKLTHHGLLSRGAMVAALVLMALFVTMQAHRMRAPALQAPEDGPVRSAFVTVIAPEGPVAQAPQHLAWKGVHRADHYRVTLEGVDGRELWRETTASTSIELSASIRELLLVNVAYFWRVEALGIDERLLASSTAVRFRVIEPAVPGSSTGSSTAALPEV